MRRSGFAAVVLVVLTGCSTTSPGIGQQQSTSRFMYEIDPETTKCVYGSRGPGNLFCSYTENGRELMAEISITEFPLEASDVPDDQDNDLWQALAEEREASALSASAPIAAKVLRTELQGPPRRPVPNADACVRYRYDGLDGTTYVDNEGVRCLFFDPRTAVVDKVVLEFIERRQRPARDPDFSREADALVANLEQIPKAQ